MDEIEILRAANMLMKHYGDKAALIATKQAMSFLEQDKPKSFEAWKRIITAIGDLEREKSCG